MDSRRTSRPVATPPPPPARGPLAIAGDALLLAVAHVPLIATTAQSIAAGARLRWVLAGLLIAQLALVAALFRRARAGVLAGLAGVSFAGLLSASLLMPASQTAALVLLGRPEGFWAPAAVLFALAAFVVMCCARLPPAVWALPIAVAAVLGASFALAMVQGVSLADLNAGGGTVAHVPVPYLQPPALAKFALPVCALIALFDALFALARRTAGRAWASVAVALLLAFPSAASHLAAPRERVARATTARPSPGVSPDAGATPEPPAATTGSGELSLTYASAWDRNFAGGYDHDVVVRTRGHRPGAPSTLEMAALVRPPADARSACRLLLGCRTPDGAVRALAPEDVELYEDGERLEVASIERRAARDAHVYLVPLFHKGERQYRERVCAALSKMVAALPAATKVSVAFHPYGKMEVKEVESRDPKKLWDLLLRSTWYRDSDQEVFGFLTHLTHELELSKVKGERYFVAIAESPVTKDGTLKPAMLAEVRRGDTPVCAIGGEPNGPMAELARGLGGVHAAGTDVDGWSRGLAAVRLALDHDYVITYTRARPPPPPVEIEKPRAGARITGPLVVKVATPKGEPFGIEVALGDVPVKTLNAPPFELTADTGPFKAGPQELRVTSIGPNGERGTTATAAVEIVHEAPQLDLHGLPEGDRITVPVTLEVRARGRPLATLALALDGKAAAAFKAPVPAPATLALDPAKLTDGQHEVKVSGTTDDGRTVARTLSFTSRRRAVEMEVTSPPKGSNKIFGRAQIWVNPKPNWADGVVTKVEAYATGGVLTDHKLGEVTSAPWLVPWPTSGFAPGPYTVRVIAHTADKVEGRVEFPVEITRPAFSVEIKSPKSGDTITGPVPVQIAISDQSALGIDRVEFSAAGKLIEKKIQAPFVATLDPSALDEGLVRVTVVAYRKDDTKAEATATVLSRKLSHVLVPVVALGPAGPLPPALLLGSTPQVTLAGKPPTSARFVSARKEPARAVIVFPASQFTHEEGNLAPLIATLTAFVKRARAAMTVGVVRYADVVRSAAEPLTAMEEVLDCLRVPFPQAGRVLYDGLAAGALAMGGASGRKLLIVIADGPDQNAGRTGAASKHVGAEVVKLIRAEDIEVHVIGFGRDLKLAPALEKALARLTVLTGGSHQVVASAGGVAAALDAVHAHAGAQVLLEIVPTVEQLKPGLHALTVTIPGEAGARLVHRAAIAVR